MKAPEFVDAIRRVVLEPTIKSVVAILRAPPGRRPSPELVELSNWYKGLSEQDKAMLERLLGMAVRHAILGVFEVLDGALKVDPSATAKDYFEVRHVHAGTEDILSGPKGMPLHELL